MPQNYFITGLPKAGKTTLLREIIAELKGRGLYVGGFISPEEKRSGKRTGFQVQDIETGRIGVLAEVDADGPKVSKYHVDIASFETVAMMSLSEFERYDVVIIDEIGYMESKSRVFLDALDRILDSPTPLIASLNDDFVGKYSSNGTVFELSEGNRQEVYKDILAEIKAITKKSERPQRAKPEKRAAKAEAAEETAPRKKAAKPPKRKAAAKKAKAPEAPEASAAKPSIEEAAVKEEKKPAEKHEAPEKKKKGLLDKIKGMLGF